ncbi:hypothetical protein A3Q56_02158 [Intoshia linei]|uniref:RRM domain-containing protein n=1 Tax=Intoshia linei TaxID=1819745 RepID=A0A177B726_9BILA|nr:hypothetical protein A3Q56_02158 [Intoshia linei]
MADVIKPNHTLYVNNLNEKIKQQELKRSLHAVFSQFGTIVEIISHRNIKMRGQAFIVFDEVTSATTALGSMQNFPFFTKEMKLQYAKCDSYAIQKRNGTYVEKVYEKKPAKTKKRKTNGGMNTVKKRPNFNLSNLNVSADALKEQPPFHILFLSNLPSNTNIHTLIALFSKFNGYQEVRMIPDNPEIAFVEFRDITSAIVAKNSLQGYQLIPGQAIRVNFAKG